MKARSGDRCKSLVRRFLPPPFPSSRRRLRPANANRSLLSSIHNTVVVIISHPEPLRFLIRSRLAAIIASLFHALREPCTISDTVKEKRPIEATSHRFCNSRSYKSCVERVVTPSSFRSGHNRDNDARVGGGARGERARLAEGKAEIWRSSCSIQLVESRDRKRAKEEGCTYVCTCVHTGCPVVRGWLQGVAPSRVRLFFRFELPVIIGGVQC